MGSNKLSWNDHTNHLKSVFVKLWENGEYTDITLCCEKKKIRSHRILLSACSTHFKEILQDITCEHPVVVLYGIEHDIMMKILHFIYTGEVCVENDKLGIFFKTAQLLQIEGLSDEANSHNYPNVTQDVPEDEKIKLFEQDKTMTVAGPLKRKRTASKLKEALKSEIPKQETVFLPKNVKLESELSETGYAEYSKGLNDLTQELDIKPEDEDSGLVY